MNIKRIITLLNYKKFNKNKYNKKVFLSKKNNNLFYKIFIIFLLIVYFKSSNKKKYSDSSINNEINYNNNINLDYENNSFIIIKRRCSVCGLFSDYIVFLGCINVYLSRGFIPIIDLKTYKNLFNGFNVNISSENPWEIFFNQPFGYNLDNVIAKGKKIKYVGCNSMTSPNYSIFANKILAEYWHKFESLYIPVKTKILMESNLIRKKLFKSSENILGILMRGTDYISRKPRHHPKVPTVEMVIKDINEMNNKYNYDWYFISTEDDFIRAEFIKLLGYKLKYHLYNKKINYNYKIKQLLSNNLIVRGNIKYMEVYLLNMIILSKCIDVICAKTSGTIGVFILTDGFRNSKVYNLGYY